MELGGTPIDPQQLIELGAIVGGLGVTGVVGFLLVRRARAARLRQIEGIDLEPGAAVPPRLKGRRRPVDEDEEAEAESGGESERSSDQTQTEREESPAPHTLKKVAGPASPPAVVPPPAIALPRPRTEVEKPTVLPRTAAPEPSEAAEPAPISVDDKRRTTSALAPGLARTRSGWISRLGQLFAGKREIDPGLLDEVEKVLLSADIGVRTSQKLLEEMRLSLSRKELSDADSAWAFLRRRTTELLSSGAPPVRWDQGHPFVLLIIGVNGSGKTTTIGKLAAKLVAQGKKVLVGAGDTFRAAAAEQLQIWADRVGAALVRGKEGADPSSVLFDAVKRARTEGFDVVIADTAGRLHTKTDLMEELQKVRRVIAKAAEGAPHETWLVIDATNGQNAIAQAQIFTQAMAVSGIVLTKLDGTAKGGVILGIADQVGIPVRFIGIGERVDDLREFNPEEFVEALYEQ